VPTWLIIVLAVLLALIVVLAVGGAIARSRRMEAGRDAFSAELEQVNRDLAAAHAEDKGWERSGLEAAARAAFAERRGSDPDELTLVQVLDLPGTDEDKAVFQARQGGREHRLTLGRRGGEWVLAELD
jgi:hypothetical protein